MKRQKPLYQPWNEEEFQADLSVRSMTPVQRWIYSALLRAAFFCSTRPYLPNNDDLLWVLAGCESKEQWLTNKASVLRCFSSSGRKLLENKRVTTDWDNLMAVRKRMAKLSKKAVAIRKTFAAPCGDRAVTVRSSNGLQVKVSEVKVSEVKVSEEKVSEEKKVIPLPPLNRQEGETEMSLKKDVTIACLAVMGIKPSIDMNTSSELSSLEQAYPGRVSDDFRAWAEEQQGHQIAYPVQTYLKVAAGRLSGAIMTEPSPDLQDFLDYVGTYGNEIRFNRAQCVALTRLLEQYPIMDVKLGFQSFFNTLDDYSIKFAAKDFTEQGTQIVRNRVQARKRLEEQQATAVRLTEEGQAEVQRLNEEYAKKLHEEETLTADAPEL